MIDEHLTLCLKISQPDWIEKLKNGEAWFGKINNYIEEAEKNNNNEQGDRFEGVFARCKRASELIGRYSNLLGDDLEIVDDGDYCFLRRKSSRLLKALCMYGIKNSDLQIIEIINDSETNPFVKFRYDIDERMYNNFLQDGSSPSEVAGFYASAGHFNEAIENSLYKNGYFWKRAMIQYDIDVTAEFCIDISDDYPELWHKRCDLCYQHESRIIVYDFNDEVKGLKIHFSPVGLNSGNCAMGALYIEGTGYGIPIE